MTSQLQSHIMGLFSEIDIINSVNPVASCNLVVLRSSDLAPAAQLMSLISLFPSSGKLASKIAGGMNAVCYNTVRHT